MKEQIAADTLVDGPEGPVARVRAVAVSPVTLEATWLIIALLDGDHVTAVPTSAASVDSGGAVRIPFGRAQLLRAPSVGDAVDERLGEQLSRALGLA